MIRSEVNIFDSRTNWNVIEDTTAKEISIMLKVYFILYILFK